MAKQSAGILAYRFTGDTAEILLAHPGGPFYTRRDLGVWSLPKGEYEMDEDPREVAKREFNEETGNTISAAIKLSLTPVKSKGGKVLYAWAVEENFENPFIRSNYFDLEWPPRSGRMQRFPEVDKAEWFTFEEARVKVFPYQIPLVDELERILEGEKQMQRHAD